MQCTALSVKIMFKKQHEVTCNSFLVESFFVFQGYKGFGIVIFQPAVSRSRASLAQRQFRLEQEDRLTTLLFARLPDPQQAEVEAIAPTALLVDMWGQFDVVEAENGRYLIELQQALCTQTIGDYCMIGGTPLYLIQARDGGPPPQELAPILPPPTITPPLLPTAAWTPPPSTRRRSTPQGSARRASS